jgi:hypothetical protein
MADRLEVRLHGEQIGWIARGTRRERIEFEWIDGYTPGPVTLTESFGSVRPKAPSAAASSFFGGYALEGRQRERLTQRRGISDRVTDEDLQRLGDPTPAAVELTFQIVRPASICRTLPAARGSSASRDAPMTGSSRDTGRSGTSTARSRLTAPSSRPHPAGPRTGHIPPAGDKSQARSLTDDQVVVLSRDVRAFVLPLVTLARCRWRCRITTVLLADGRS